jgi:CP family cyanate transporter-like MFS transporter
MPWLVVTGVLVAAVSMRGPILAPTPVLNDIRQDLGIEPATAGLLTTAPVLMFALLTPVAAFVIRRAGAEVALMTSLAGVLLGTFIRALPGFGWMLTGMLVIGAAVTIGNVVIPVIIRREVPPDQVAVVTAGYTATLNVGSLVTSLATAPLADVLGWNGALLAWSVLTMAGILVWGVHLRRERHAGMAAGDRFSGEPAESAPRVNDVDPETLTGPLPVVLPNAQPGSVLRRPIVWLLVSSFALQATMYYGLSTWLPTLAADELGLSAGAAGALASIFQGVGIVGAFVVPVLLRFTPDIVPTLVIGASWLVLAVGMLLAPELLALWLSAGAIGHAGGFVVIFSALVAAARDDREAATMSALVQGGGYGVAALGGPLFGALYQATGGWTAVLVMLLAMAFAYAVLLVAAHRASRRSSY